MSNSRSNCEHRDWLKDPFGPWICKTCGTWSMTKLQAQSVAKDTLGLKVVIREESSDVAK